MLETSIVPLTMTKAGARVRIVELCCDGANNRLRGMGLILGAELTVIGRTAGGAVVVAMQDQRLGLGADMAGNIQVIQADFASEITITKHTNSERSYISMMSPTPVLRLRDLAVGSTACVAGYEATARSYKRKLLAMGLTPGTEFTVTRHAPLGDPIEVKVRGFCLSLRKDEADALLVALTTEGGNHA
ncbi:MAG: ferrous iron transport protein A [Chroococcidiopsidaceae cyanobacterium CP_BM_RX_35]|nr:ferrous iron transport protein A [Chroococcidiopsidaceae cyanobacterium CP_BM_RX_35]